MVGMDCWVLACAPIKIASQSRSTVKRPRRQLAQACRPGEEFEGQHRGRAGVGGALTHSIRFLRTVMMMSTRTTGSRSSLARAAASSCRRRVADQGRWLGTGNGGPYFLISIHMTIQYIVPCINHIFYYIFLKETVVPVHLLGVELPPI